MQLDAHIQFHIQYTEYQFMLHYAIVRNSMLSNVGGGLG